VKYVGHFNPSLFFCYIALKNNLPTKGTRNIKVTETRSYSQQKEEIVNFINSVIHQIIYYYTS